MKLWMALIDGFLMKSANNHIIYLGSSWLDSSDSAANELAALNS